MNDSWKKKIKNSSLTRWIDECIELCKPAAVYLCSGSKEEYENFCKELVAKGTFIALNPEKRPRSFLARSHPSDVARLEDHTYICSEKEEDAGPTNNWCDPLLMRNKLSALFNGCMEGRTLYIIPYCMGPLNSPMSHIGVELTDSAYVAANMHIMTRTGEEALEMLGEGPFVPGLHSVGCPLPPGVTDDPWPCNIREKYIVHFPETKEIWSFGSGYGGNALLGKKCFALRIASSMANEQGWLAEHMLILSITPPEGRKRYIAAAFPSACGKTNLAMLTPTLPGWKIETVGDDIAWMKFGSDGRLYAINPEAGLFGVAPGTSIHSNPNAIKTISSDTIFTNVALTDDLDVWWEGLTPAAPAHLIDWRGKEWTPGNTNKAAQCNSRFTAPITRCPCVDPDFNNPHGVPISAILFGGRRSCVAPLVYEAFSWQHGIFMGASISSETTAASEGITGRLRHDPFAMLPFCGYNMGDYFLHWLNIGQQSSPDKRPRIFYVNWFRQDSLGGYLWPGFGENSRVLKWILDRIDHKASGKRSPIGILPLSNELDRKGLSLSDQAIEKLLEINSKEWLEDCDELEEYFKIFADKLPGAISKELNNLKERLIKN